MEFSTNLDCDSMYRCPFKPSLWSSATGARKLFAIVVSMPLLDRLRIRSCSIFPKHSEPIKRYLILVDVFHFSIQQEDISTTSLVTDLINMASHVIITVGGHLMAIAFTFPNWPRLTKILHEMEDKKMFSSIDFKIFRSVCRKGLLALMVVSTLKIAK